MGHWSLNGVGVGTGGQSHLLMYRPKRRKSICKRKYFPLPIKGIFLEQWLPSHFPGLSTKGLADVLSEKPSTYYVHSITTLGGTQFPLIAIWVEFRGSDVSMENKTIFYGEDTKVYIEGDLIWGKPVEEHDLNPQAACKGISH